MNHESNQLMINNLKQFCKNVWVLSLKKFNSAALCYAVRINRQNNFCLLIRGLGVFNNSIHEIKKEKKKSRDTAPLEVNLEYVDYFYRKQIRCLTNNV